MDTITILSLIGVPSICATAFWAIINAVKNKQLKRQNEQLKKQAELEEKDKQFESDIKLLKGGMQAQLRAQMVSEFYYWTTKGYAPIYARENAENVYKNYHGLGANGVMDDLYKKFFMLPTEKPKKGAPPTSSDKSGYECTAQNAEGGIKK